MTIDLQEIEDRARGGDNDHHRAYENAPSQREDLLTCVDEIKAKDAEITRLRVLVEQLAGALGEHHQWALDYGPSYHNSAIQGRTQKALAAYTEQTDA